MQVKTENGLRVLTRAQSLADGGVRLVFADSAGSMDIDVSILSWGRAFSDAAVGKLDYIDLTAPGIELIRQVYDGRLPPRPPPDDAPPSGLDWPGFIP